jgi:hypothetical protein
MITGDFEFQYPWLLFLLALLPVYAFLHGRSGKLGALSFPPDGDPKRPYPLYDRWGDSFNLTTEFVVANQGRSLASLAYWFAQSPLKAQGWRAGSAQIRLRAWLSPMEFSAAPPSTAARLSTTEGSISPACKSGRIIPTILAPLTAPGLHCLWLGILLITDSPVRHRRKDWLLSRASPRCILCTARPLSLGGDICRADGHGHSIGTHIFLHPPSFKLHAFLKPNAVAKVYRLRA